MSDIEVIYDPAKEFAAIVNIDTRRGWGPAFVGPDAGTILQTWVESMPFDVTILSDDAASTVFQDWLETLVKGATETPVTAPDSPLEPMGGVGVDQTAPDRTGPDESGGEPPAPGPADTDMEADAGTPPTVVTCPLCAGVGSVVDEDTGEVSACNMCGGAKVVRMVVPA